MDVLYRLSHLISLVDDENSVYVKVYPAGTVSVHTSDRSLGLGPADDDGGLSDVTDGMLSWSIRSCAGGRNISQ